MGKATHHQQKTKPSKVARHTTPTAEELCLRSYVPSMLGTQKNPPQIVPAPAPLPKPLQGFMGKVQRADAAENGSRSPQARYDAQVARAGEYTDAYVNGQNNLSAAQKADLKRMFRAIAMGAAGMETGWNPDVVEGSRNRPHTGVYQEEWNYIHQAAQVVKHHPELQAVLKQHPQDQAVLGLWGDGRAHGMPATSYAGQGAAFAAMAVDSYTRFIAHGGKQAEFNGNVVYHEHMMGISGAAQFQNQFNSAPFIYGKPGISASTYGGNYLLPSHPLAGVNDLNPYRITYDKATAGNVSEMMHEKAVMAYSVSAANHVAPERLQAFAHAFLPNWEGRDGAQNKAADIKRVGAEREAGSDARAQAHARMDAALAEYHAKKDHRSTINHTLTAAACHVLRPLTLHTGR